MKLFQYALLAALAFCFILGCAGNGTTSEAGNALSLNLTDSNGVPIPGVVALLCKSNSTCQDTIASDTSSAVGYIEFTDIAKGTYTIFMLYGEQSMTLSVQMSGKSDEQLGTIPFQDGTSFTPQISPLIGGEYWSDSIEGKQRYYFFESESLLLMKRFYHKCQISEGYVHWQLRTDSLWISMDSSMIQMGRTYPFEAADSAEACQYEYKEMKGQGSRSLPFEWITEPTSFRINFSTLHFKSDSIPPDTTWELKTFKRL